MRGVRKRAIFADIKYCFFDSRLSIPYCLTNLSVFAVFHEAVNLLCKLPCGGSLETGLDTFYRIIETGLIYIMAIRVVEFSNGGYKIRKIFA